MGEELVRLKKYEKSVKWSQIISFTREDAVRTGYDNREAFQNLIRSKAPEIAKLYNISLDNLVINAAYHDKAWDKPCRLSHTKCRSINLCAAQCFILCS